MRLCNLFLIVFSVKEDFHYREKFYNVSKKKSPHRAIPRLGSDRSKLTVKLKRMDAKRLNICYHSSFGVHSPYEHPTSLNDYEFVEIGYGVSMEILITPEVIFAEEYLKEYPIDKRYCMFDEDRRLNFLKTYTQKNCEMDCLTSFLMKRCGCSPYEVISNETARICSTHNRQCYKKHIGITRMFKNGFMKFCNCWPACNSVKYKIDVLTKELTNVTDETLITFKFKDATYTPYRRYQQFQFIDFMSQSGGILGLFAGVSFLSIVELFYLIGMRNLTNVLRVIKIKLRF